MATAHPMKPLAVIVLPNTTTDTYIMEIRRELLITASDRGDKLSRIMNMTCATYNIDHIKEYTAMTFKRMPLTSEYM